MKNNTKINHLITSNSVNVTTQIILISWFILAGTGLLFSQNDVNQNLEVNSQEVNSQQEQEDQQERQLEEITEDNPSSDTKNTVPNTASTSPEWGEKRYAQLYDSKSQVYRNVFFKNILLNYSVENFFESYYNLSTYQVPAMGDYSYPDNYIFSLLGNSWHWNKYYHNGFNINDTFFTGRTLHKTPMFSKDLEVNAIDGRLDFTTFHDTKIAYFKANLGYLGGHIPMYKFLSDPYSLQAPQLRERPPPEERRRNEFNFEIYYKDLTIFDESTLWLDAFITLRTRNNLDFDYLGNHSLYKESYFQTTITTELQNHDGTRPFGFLFTYLNRDQLYSEFYYHSQETANLDNFAFSGYYKSPWNIFTQLHGLNFSYKSIKKNQENFARNLFDVTAEGLYPFYPSVSIFEFSQHSTLGYSFNVYKPGFLKLAANFNNALMIINPTTSEYQNDIYFKSASNTLSLYQTQWKAASFSSLLIENQFTLEINQDSTEGKSDGFNVDGKLGFDVNGFVAGNSENIVRFAPHFELGMDILKMNRTSYGHDLRIEIGRKNIPFSSEYILFLSDDYQSGESYLWTNDNNNNLLAEEGEVDQNSLHSTTGGKYRSIDPNFDQPHYYYLDIPYNVDFAKYWSFGLVGHYRIFKDQAWVRLSETDGTYRTNGDGVNVYYPNNGEKNYIVHNLSKDKFPEEGRNWFSDSPFYIGFTLGFTAEYQQLYYFISFSAFMINGITTLGNGPLHNAQGTLSELMADPNTTYHGVGRLDADRGYRGNMGLIYYFLPEFTGKLSVKYRDGQPIGKWGAYLDETARSVSFLRTSVSGDNILLYNGEFGTREDALWTIDLDVKYTHLINNNPLSFTLGFYNLFDFGRELIEYSFYHNTDNDRNALETQVPRGMTFSVEYIY